MRVALTIAVSLLLGACGEQRPDAAALHHGMLPQTAATERFVLRTNLPAEQLAFQRDVIAGFWRWFEDSWFPVPAGPPLDIFLFADRASCEAWEQKVGLVGAAGRYLPELRLLVVDLETGLGTTLHELTHHFLMTACARYPQPFVNEGIATFFEKFLGHLDAERRLHLTVGYFHPFRHMQTSAQHAGRHIDQQWGAAAADVDYPTARSFFLFVHEQGQLQAFARALLTADGDGRRELEQLCGRPLAQLEREWHEWVEAHPPTFGGDTMLVQASSVLEEPAWHDWLRDNADKLVFDEQRQRYRCRQ